MELHAAHTAHQTRGPVRFGVVGSGYRTGVFARLAELMPQRFVLEGVVTRSTARADQILQQWRVPGYTDLTAFLERHPVDFMITSTPVVVTPEMIMKLVGREVPVLAETPPARDAESLRTLWKQVGGSGLVQVAEQYPYAPGNVARRAVLDTGVLGRITWAEVSSTQTYHAAALLRQMLGIGFEPAEVSARTFELPLVDPQTRAGWSDDLEPQPRTTTVATLDFGDRVGVYDYTDNQVRNPIRANRMVVRGSHGELVDDRLTRLAAPGTPLRSELTRWQTGDYLSFEERDLYQIGDGERVLYRNPYFGQRLSEEEIAVATLLERAGHWVRESGEPPYPLARAAQDQLLALAVAESARTGRLVRTDVEDWADEYRADEDRAG